MLIKDFNHTIDSWIQEAEQSSFYRICAKPSPDSWSLGQVCVHLIEATRHYLEEINICLSTDDNATEEMAPHGKAMFQNNAFPDEFIEGPPTNSGTQQPESKEELLRSLKTLKAEINNIAIRISENPSAGKTKHPGLRYFNASEWLQFAEMHSRHHLRQKKRIEEFLKINGY
jgi:hypothetical protein